MPQIESAEAQQQLEQTLEHFPDRRASLIPLLQEIQTTFYYLPEPALRRVARKLRMTLPEVYQVATFYRCFSLKPRGKHLLQVCLGTACHVRGAPRVMDRVLTDLKLSQPGTTPDCQFTVLGVRCVGCCGLAPVVRVDNNTHPHMSQAKVKGMLRKYAQPAGEAPKMQAEAEGESDAAAEVG